MLKKMNFNSLLPHVTYLNVCTSDSRNTSMFEYFTLRSFLQKIKISFETEIVQYFE